MENQVPNAVQIERMGRLLELQTNISYEMNLPYVGRTEKVLIHKQEGSLYTGRTLSNKLVHINTDEENLIGRFVYVKINSVGAFYLTGELERKN